MSPHAFQDLVDWNTLAHAQGYKTIVETMTSRCGSTGYGGESGDALKGAVNALILANADVFDWVSNQAASPLIGADGACNNPTYFADANTGFGTHFTDAGQVPYVAAERAAFEGVYRTAQTAIAGAYTQVASDALIVASGSSAYTVALMDANTGNFNANGRVCVQNSGAGQVTLQGVAGESFGVGPGAEVCLRPHVADARVAGAMWVVVP